MSACAEDKGEGRKGALRKGMSCGEKTARVKPLSKLRQQEDILERGLPTAIANMKLDSGILEDILHDRTDAAARRRNFTDVVSKKLEDIGAELKSVKRITEDPVEMQKLDVNAYKLRLIQLSQKMQDVKKSSSIETLIEEQTVLEAELVEFESGLRKYENTVKHTTNHPACGSREDKRMDFDYREIQDFHALVAKTGHTENWSEEDHLLFLKTRRKCSSIPALVSSIRAKCPDLLAEAIVNHEAWYKVYLALREKQKSAVQEWRKQKELRKARSTEKDDQEEINGSPAYEPDFYDILSKEKPIRSKTSIRRVTMTRRNNSADTNRSKTKELISQWKIERENKRSMDAEQLRMQTQVKREMEENRRRKKREEIEAALSEYKRKKSLEDALKESCEIQKEKRKADVALIKAFRQQDDEYTKKRRDSVLRLKNPNKNHGIKMKGSEDSKVRRHSTLLNATKVWTERCKAEDVTTRRCNELQYIKNIPKTCTKWRNEESIDMQNNLMIS